MAASINPLNSDHYAALNSVITADAQVRPYLQKLAALMPEAAATLQQWEQIHGFCVGCLQHFPPPVGE